MYLADIRFIQLFEEAILCVSDDKRKGIGGKIVDGLAGPSMDLRLKGRVYARHIRTIVDSSHEGGLSLTIRMSDDALDEFIMVFKDRPTLELWKAQIEVVVSQYLTPSALLPPPPPPAASMGLGMNRNGRGITNSTSHDSFRSGSDYGGSGASDSSRSAAHSSSFSNYTRTTTSSVPVSSVIHEEQASDFQRDYNDSPPDQTYPSLYRQPSGNLSISNREVMRSYTPLDLMLILSVPSTGATELKLNILKSTLDFLINNVGPRTRISLVTFSTGEGIRGSLHKTPFIAVGTQEGRSRLDNIVRALGSPDSDSAGLVEHKEERVHVVTAINLALDILLQRKVCLLDPVDVLLTTDPFPFLVKECTYRSCANERRQRRYTKASDGSRQCSSGSCQVSSLCCTPCFFSCQAADITSLR